MSEKLSQHTTPAGGNVFADLGFSPEEAKRLKANSEQRIKADLKIQLMEEIRLAIRESRLKQEVAAIVMGVNRPRVSDVMTGKASKFTLDALVDMLQRLGRRVTLQVVDQTDETAYLLGTESNRMHLEKSIKQYRNAEFIDRNLKSSE